MNPQHPCQTPVSTALALVGLASLALTSCFPDAPTKLPFTGTWLLDTALSEAAILAAKEYQEQPGTPEEKAQNVRAMISGRSGLGFKVTEDSIMMVNPGTGEGIGAARALVKKSDDGNSVTFGPPAVTVVYADSEGQTVKVVTAEQDWIDNYMIYARQ